MSSLQQIQTVIQRTARRRRWSNALEGMWKGLFAGAVLWLIALGIFKLAPVPAWSVLAGGIGLAVITLSGFIVGWWRSPGDIATARWVDEQSGLKERISTALELGSKEGDPRWKELVLKDAVNFTRDLEPKRLLPFHLPHIVRWTVVLLVLAAGLGFVPEYRSEAYLEAKNDEANIKETGRVLADLTQRMLDKRPPALEPTEQALQAVNETGLKLNKNAVTKNEALKDLSNVADRLKEELNDLAKNPALKKMQQNMREPRSASGNTSSADLQKNLDELQKQLGEGAQNPEALDQLQKKLDDLKQQAAQMAGQEGGMTAEQQQQMAQQLSQLAQQAAQMGASVPQLQEAIDALKMEDAGMFLSKLDTALEDLEKMKQLAEAMQQLQEQMAQLGKDLAEQLEKGQAQAAAESLQKMIEKLNQSELSEQQKQGMMEELAKAIDPAGEYGKVAEHLKEGMKQMQSGDQQGASQSLAAARDELQQMMDQMGDAQDLMATLEALQKAQMAVMTGQCLGQCNSDKFTWGKGGKPGRGVGTWADENGWQTIPEISDLWDNTGINRPDMDPRGQTDRGEGQLAENVDPTKLRGQMSPGKSMPSVTLKGVSIKGVSRVDYEEAVTAAQSDAQSALSEDKVPRAYRGAVKGYFDDFE